MYGATADPALLSDRYLAISYNADGADYVVLDTTSGMYFSMDTAGPDETLPIGHNVGQLLDWLWKSRIAPEG
jgi:hypothetical protein